MASLRTRIYVLGLAMFFVLFISYFWRSGVSISDVDLGFKSPDAWKTTVENRPTPVPSATPKADSEVKEPTSELSPSSSPSPSPSPPPPPPKPPIQEIPGPKYKPDRPPPVEVVDNFPVAAAAHSATDLPSIPPWTRPPNPHVPEKTPLFIGFTRNWLLLQQNVVSHIAAGWPAEDIYVFENTGTMKSNERGLLSLQNPFFLNHTRLQMFGVNIIITPTLLTFSQLQNFYIYTAIEKNFTTYFWGHMDVIILPYEDKYEGPLKNVTGDGRYSNFKSPYKLAVETLRNATSPEPDINAKDPKKPWAIRFFSYDRLALVNRAAYEKVGGWDTAIPYYITDCDMHERIPMNGYDYPPGDILIGNFSDVAGTLDDLIVLYRKKNTVQANYTVDWDPEEARREQEEKAAKDLDGRADIQASDGKWESDVPGSPAYDILLDVVRQMDKHKNRNGGGGRNTWQRLQTGGQGEPYYRDPEGFDRAIGILTQAGRDVYAEKWGHRNCELIKNNRKVGDEWRVEHDWE